MFVGHYAPALVLRARVMDAPLWALFLAAQLVDVAFFLLCFPGVERFVDKPGEHPPFEVTSGVVTHSLAATPLWALGAFVAGAAWRGARVGAALAAATASHWLLDLIVHVPDLPLGLTQQPAVGLGLWRRPLLSFGLEMVLLAGSYLLLRPRLAAHERARADRLVPAMALVQGLYHFQLVPLPPSQALMALGALAGFVLLAAAAWSIERPLPQPPA
jgi:hypothetical protein